MKTFIGIDVGTQGTKAAVFSQDGRCLGRAFMPSRLHQPRAGVVEEDPEVQFASVCKTIRQCVRQARIATSSVAAIGVDGQMAGVIGLGSNGLNATPYDSWLDTRCRDYIHLMQKQAGDEIFAKTGGPASFNHGPKILWWKHKRKAAYSRIASFVQPSGYVAMRLCGLGAKQAFIDKSYLHFSGFADNRASNWDNDLCRQFGLDQAKLPRIVDCDSIVGELTAKSARACGLPGGVPVIAGCGDSVASFLSCGAVEDGILIDVAGTASVYAATTSSFRPDLKHRTLACGQSAVKGLWHPYAYINGGGMNLEWFRREIANRNKSAATPDDFDELNLQASRVKPSDDLPMFIPHLGGRVSPAQPDLRGAWSGLTWQHTVPHLYRSVLEAVALEYAIYNNVLGSLYPSSQLRELRVTGGGEKSAFWNTIKADVLQVPVRRIAGSEGAVLGVAMLAAVGVGALPSLKQASAKWVSTGQLVRPHKTMNKYYTRRLALYEQLLERLNSIR